MVRQRRFHGKFYTWVSDFKLRGNARHFAEGLQELGYETEITKGDNKYNLYAREKDK